MGGNAVEKTNGQPTVFYSDFNAHNKLIEGTLEVTENPTADDDYIGFALGFNPGDSGNSSASYLLVDWKQVTQSFNFTGGDADNTAGSSALVGLAVSQVSGIPTADEFWGHQDDGGSAAGGLSELARATNLGNTGWADQTQYDFRFVFLPNQLQVFVDNVLELDIAGNFSDGRFAFYDFSQATATSLRWRSRSRQR